MKILNKFICFCICASVMAVPLFISDAQAQDYPKAKKVHNAPKNQNQPNANNPAPNNNNYNNGRNPAPNNNNYNNGRNPAPPNNNNYNNGRNPAPPNNNNYNNGRNPAPNNNRYNVPNYTNNYMDSTPKGSSPDAGSDKIKSDPNPNGGRPVFLEAKNPYGSEAQADAAFNKRYASDLSKWKTIERGYLDNPSYFSRFDNDHLLEMYSSLSVLYSDLERDIVRSNIIEADKPPFSLNIKMHAINSFEQIDHLAGFMEKELSKRKLTFKKIKRHVFED